MGKKWQQHEQVWVMVYSHKHGIDTTVYKTQEDAQASAQEIMDSDWEGEPYTELWEISDGSEGIDITDTYVMSLLPPVSIEVIKGLKNGEEENKEAPQGTSDPSVHED